MSLALSDMDVRTAESSKLKDFELSEFRSSVEVQLLWSI